MPRRAAGIVVATVVASCLDQTGSRVTRIWRAPSTKPGACGAAISTARCAHVRCILANISALSRMLVALYTTNGCMTWVTQGRFWYTSKAVIAAVISSQDASGCKAASTALRRSASGNGVPRSRQRCACAKIARGSSLSTSTCSCRVSPVSAAKTRVVADTGVKSAATAAADEAKLIAG